MEKYTYKKIQLSFCTIEDSLKEEKQLNEFFKSINYRNNLNTLNNVYLHFTRLELSERKEDNLFMKCAVCKMCDNNKKTTFFSPLTVSNCQTCRLNFCRACIYPRIIKVGKKYHTFLAVQADFGNDFDNLISDIIVKHDHKLCFSKCFCCKMIFNNFLHKTFYHCVGCNMILCLDCDKLKLVVDSEKDVYQINIQETGTKRKLVITADTEFYDLIKKEKPETKECKICLTEIYEEYGLVHASDTANPDNDTCDQIMHTGFCLACAIKFKFEIKRCLYCRTKVDNYVKIINN